MRPHAHYYEVHQLRKVIKAIPLAPHNGGKQLKPISEHFELRKTVLRFCMNNIQSKKWNLITNGWNNGRLNKLKTHGVIKSQLKNKLHTNYSPFDAILSFIFNSTVVASTIY